MPRKYELRKRAERREETRRRIVEAAVDLHSTIGPAKTSIAAIADSAGVQRHTVYAHFPDLRSLFGACSHHWDSEHPFPDPRRWFLIDDPGDRLRAALDDVYGWYERVEADLALFHRDRSLVPEEGELLDAQDAELAALAGRLADGFPPGRAVRAAIGHALEFETWRSLARRQGLSRSAAVDAMAGLAEASSAKRPARRRG